MYKGKHGELTQQMAEKYNLAAGTNAVASGTYLLSQFRSPDMLENYGMARPKTTEHPEVVAGIKSGVIHQMVQKRLRHEKDILEYREEEARHNAQENKKR